MFNKAVIFAGGKGTRFLEQTRFLPKPMIMAKSKPLLIHIINHYKKFNVGEFYVLTGYKQEIIEKYFIENKDYIKNDDAYLCSDGSKVFVVDTGQNTLTGGRLLKAFEKYNFDNFYLTYGDGISDVNIKSLTDFHLKHSSIGTVTAVNPPPRFGNLELVGDSVVDVKEKHKNEGSWINGGYFAFNREIKKYLKKDEPFEQTPLKNLSRDNELFAYKHRGYWQCVDTIRELEVLESDMDSKKFIQ